MSGFSLTPGLWVTRDGSVVEIVANTYRQCAPSTPFYCPTNGGYYNHNGKCGDWVTGEIVGPYIQQPTEPKLTLLDQFAMAEQLSDYDDCDKNTLQVTTLCGESIDNGDPLHRDRRIAEARARLKYIRAEAMLKEKERTDRGER